MMSYKIQYDLFEIILVIRNYFHKEIMVDTFQDSSVVFNVYDYQEISALIKLLVLFIIDNYLI